jgi:uracil-DNA glycosylase
MTKPRKTAKPTGSAADFIPPRPTLAKLRAASKGCQGCDLFKLGTQTVFGEGPSSAHVMVVGEQPGDMGDRAGKPFVGPSGKLLDRAFDAAGIAREDVYVTNAVKHFKWKPAPRGKRRLHQRPDAGEMRACRPWLETELAVVKPEALVCLGAVAAQSLLGPSFRITRERGKFLDSDLAPRVLATYHPSAILRAEGHDRELMRADLVGDLAVVAEALSGRVQADSPRDGAGIPWNGPARPMTRKDEGRR